MVRRKKRSTVLRVIQKIIRKTAEALKSVSDRMETYLDSAREDTSELVMRTIGRTRRITRKIELRNFIRLLTVLTIFALLANLLVDRERASVIFFNDHVEVWVITVSFILLLMNIFYFLWQTILAFQYKPVPPDPDALLPGCTVIVPAYNEGRQIALTLETILQSDYPPEKLEIIAIDDGSVDDTWDWMRRIAEESKGRIRTIRLEKNAGKRNAIHQALLASEKEIFVTIDSDSEVLPDTLRQLVSPFRTDPNLGGVAGNIRVLNLDDGIIPRMLDVNFVFGFDFTRSAQSRIRSVMCTPGALSAYRRRFLMPFMKEWLEQTFCGQPAGIGEDRAITNIILREGYGVTFQRQAYVFTEVPSEYIPLCKMFIRWARSNIRENLDMFRFAFRRFRLDDEDRLGMQINLVMQTIWMFTPILFVFSTLYCLMIDARAFLYSVLTVTVIWSTFPAFVYATRYDKNESLWSYVYGLFNFVALSWIAPYALLTVHRSGWLTRQKNTPKKMERK